MNIPPEITKEIIYNLFDLPAGKAAKKLGVGTSTFQVYCRDLGIERWPYMQVNSLSKQIAKIEQILRINDLAINELNQLNKIKEEMESALSEIKQGQFCRIKSRIDSPHLDFVKNCFKKYFKLKKDSKTDLSSTHSKKPNVSKKLAKKESQQKVAQQSNKENHPFSNPNFSQTIPLTMPNIYDSSFDPVQPDSPQKNDLLDDSSTLPEIIKPKMPNIYDF